MNFSTYVSQRMKKKTFRFQPWTDRILWRSALLVYLASFSLTDNKTSELWKILSEQPGRWARIWESSTWGRISTNSNLARGFNWTGLKEMAPGISRTICSFSANGKGVSRPQTSPSLMLLSGFKSGACRLKIYLKRLGKIWETVWGTTLKRISECG